MSQMLGVNSNNDIYLNESGNIVVLNGLQAVMQACENAAKAQFQEMVLAYDQGVPNFQTIWTNSNRVAQYEAFLRRAIRNVEGVTEIKELQIRLQNNTVQYEATIATIYGTGVLNNG